MLIFCAIIFITVHLVGGRTSSASSASSVLSRSDIATWHQMLPRVTTHTDLPAIKFQTVDQELVALISFITSTSDNVLQGIDPSVPLDPGSVLDFDPSHPHAQQDFDLLQEEIHALYPLVLFGKMRDPWHREVKKMLAEFKIVPAPLIIELDQRTDNAILSELLSRLLGTNNLPQLTLSGKSMGSYHDVLDLREKGELKTTLENAGMSVQPAKKNKMKLKELQREEMERILKPRPIVDGR